MYDHESMFLPVISHIRVLHITGSHCQAKNNQGKGEKENQLYHDCKNVLKLLTS